MSWLWRWHGDLLGLSLTSATPRLTPARMPPGPRPCAGRGPADPENRLVGKVLTGNGITRYANGACSLVGGDELSDSGRLESECGA